MALPGIEEYQTACPEASRRTSTGALVKLFAATVTTVGVHGHLSSLHGSLSWRRDLVRAVEVVINPLAPVFTFTTAQFWYGFIDLLRISPGPWKTEISLRYRFARLCNCGLTVAAISPHHLETTALERDLKWAGRLLILLVLLGQYSQAAVLLVRRFLSGTEAGVDYAMLLLVFSGLVGLFQSITISLLNVTWTLQSQVQPCTEPLCSLNECTSLKQEQGLPHKEGTIAVFGHNIAPISRTVLYELAGGYAQFWVITPGRNGIWTVLRILWSGHICWLSSIYCVLGIDSLRRLMNTDNGDHQIAVARDPTSGEQPSEQVPPAPITNFNDNGTNQSESLNLLETLMLFLLFIVGVLSVSWLCMSMLFQLSVLVGPGAILYMRIASETSSWKEMDAMKPCPQLWKDDLEDELWSF
ncbi:hypothetical protein KVR01_009446 [Diaporthe batatas]|uniref:uncharacterized protein n=1 Tax=Diaporthe batatas TaxID=748121 RepID=UPI001D04687D|nr:uncharacterized protein KVR01_009446 [Diaporthe batatas]KAG8161182.1 hypothetical protein KVR01_009446 [Diaporthe batatas]